MKIVLVALLFAASAVAQNPSATLPAACGSENVNFDVKLDNSRHMLQQPEAGKARVYFLQDSFSTRIGLDGKWVGANRSHSYFSVSVDPGEHHLCAKVDAPMDHPIELVHFTAEAGKVYYFRGRVVPPQSGVYLFFERSDIDEAQYLLSSYSLSVSQIKK
jgi:hypothetical protein